MGYTTDFTGSININKKVDKSTKELLDGLSSTRRMKRNPEKLAIILGISEEECINKYGEDAKHYFDNSGNYGNLGQHMTDDIVNYNYPPANHPGLWCNWCLGENEQSIEWTGGEKFYEYIQWMKYIVNELEMRGYTLNGSIQWEGEDERDKGCILVTDNNVSFLI